MPYPKMKWLGLPNLIYPLRPNMAEQKPPNAESKSLVLALFLELKHFPPHPSLSCTPVAAGVFSKHAFYYHITSHGCRDLEGDLDSGWIICLCTGISHGAAGWLNTAPGLKCWRQSFQQGTEKRKSIQLIILLLSGFAFFSNNSAHSPVAPMSQFLFFKPMSNLIPSAPVSLIK